MTIEEAIKTAIQYEQRVVQVYDEAARTSQHAVGKKIYAAFIKEEEEHVVYLVERLNEWKATGRVTPASLGTVIPSRERIEEGVKKLESQVARKAPGAETRLLKRPSTSRSTRAPSTPGWSKSSRRSIGRCSSGSSRSNGATKPSSRRK